MGHWAGAGPRSKSKLHEEAAKSHDPHPCSIPLCPQHAPLGSRGDTWLSRHPNHPPAELSTCLKFSSLFSTTSRHHDLQNNAIRIQLFSPELRGLPLLPLSRALLGPCHFLSPPSVCSWTALLKRFSHKKLRPGKKMIWYPKVCYSPRETSASVLEDKCFI